MRIHVLGYIGAEEDIVEGFVRHTLRFADRLTIVSTERGPTREILGRLQQEGLPLDITDHHPSYHDQHEVLTRLLRHHKHEADWFLPLDADEFVIGDIRNALATADISRPRSLRWRTYVPLPDDDISEPDILQRIRHRRSPETPQFTKIVIPSAVIRRNTSISQGNHTLVTRSWLRPPTDVWGTSLENVSLAHFPVRSAPQMERKIARSWPAVVRNPKRLASEAFHWKLMHDRYNGRALDADDLTAIALRYSAPADAPVPGIVEDPAA
jgi:hypothetical protein